MWAVGSMKKWMAPIIPGQACPAGCEKLRQKFLPKNQLEVRNTSG